MNITLEIPYKIIFDNDTLVDHLGLNPYLLREGIADPEDTHTIYISEDNVWILDWLKEYLS